MAITDSDHPDIPWRVPERLPAEHDLRVMLNRCSMILEGEATPGFAKQCIAKLMVAFEPNTKLSAEETRLRATVWLEACGDLNDALWAQATADAIKTLKWMPKPAEFRALMEAHTDLAKRRQRKIHDMLAAHRAKPAGPFVAEPLEVRIRAMRDGFRRVGQVDKAAGYERELAAIEEREPEAWATAATPEMAEARPDRPPFKPGTSPTARRCAELARMNRSTDDAKDPAQSRGTP